ncbi:hypothetical protein TSUD_13540 [Trifolium subterraneum]|uniref:Uncharacterized protein n=1 Tax=Trifolium subterraneum TaxID=3900 RepID=A0A2Z6PGG6_TRISU|nr:hypothetical protein TSUD_13540 [Trifolium subterraneum]
MKGLGRSKDDNQIMTNTLKEFPDFFKVFLTEKHTERMLIPIAFAKLVRLKRRVMKDVILRDRRGRDWHVKVRPIGRKSIPSVPKLEDDEIDAEMYIQEGNPFFFAKHMHHRPNQLDVETDEIASYHHVLPQMSTTHRNERRNT